MVCLSTKHFILRGLGKNNTMPRIVGSIPIINTASNCIIMMLGYINCFMWGALFFKRNGMLICRALEVRFQFPFF
ncbi:hypothetical protein AM500_12230 [Bacillus sp. FJAT-18017]|nr:hypothetical protein AM500_12230 [Bacillus sp. FJAT-18017]